MVEVNWAGVMLSRVNIWYQSIGQEIVKLGQWLGLIILLIALYIVWEIRQLLLLVFASVVLATALNRLARQFQRLGLNRPPSVGLAVFFLFAFFIAVFWLVVPPFTNEFQQLTLLVPQGLDRLNSWLLNYRTQLPPQITDTIPNLENLAQQIQPLIERLLGGSLAIVGSSLTFVLNFLLLLVLAMMLLINPSGYRHLFISLFPSFYRRRVESILQQCEIALGGWITGALTSMLIVSLLSGFGLAIIGVKLALANAVMAGLLNFIPNIGPTFSIVPPMAIALLDDGWKAIFVLVLYIAIQQFESSLLTPYIMAQQVALLPALTLLCQVFFATVFGFFGLVMALPLTVVGQVWLREALIRDVLDQWKPQSVHSAVAIDNFEIEKSPHYYPGQPEMEGESGKSRD
jgi:predicted PurR-regulated permease PerM